MDINQFIKKNLLMIYFYPLNHLEETISNQSKALISPVRKSLQAIINNSAKEKFEFHSKGQMAIIGKRTGIATFLGMNISGFWAWLLWRNVYLSKISTFDKKVRVFLDWTIDLFFDRDISRLKLKYTEKYMRIAYFSNFYKKTECMRCSDFLYYL